MQEGKADSVRRLLFNGLAIASASLLVLALVGRIASMRGDFGVERYHQGKIDGRDDWLFIGDGRLVWHARAWDGDDPPGTRYRILHRERWQQRVRPLVQWGGSSSQYGFFAERTYVFVGFEASWGLDGGNYIGHNRMLAIPLWFLAIVAAIAPALWTRAIYRRRQRIRAGRCLNCGYDLRASSDRCPECGSPRS
jgi:hypothetical protein